MNETTPQDGAIDGLLSKYFRAKLPHPWPKFRAPASLPRASRWLSYRRVAVAASIGVLLAGYLALAGFFPREITGRLNDDPTRHIGKAPNVPRTQPNP